MDREIAKILLDAKAVILRVDPPFRWTSGILSPVYTDNRILMSFPEKRKIIVESFLKLIQDYKLKPEAVAGIATSGIPWASWIAESLGLPLVYIRKKKKEHGKENLIEGKLDKGQKTIIIEDLISTGKSSLNGVTAVKQAGAEVIANMAIFTYELEEARKAFEDVKLLTLTTFSALVEVAEKEGYIAPDDQKRIAEWKKDPYSWR